ncbi:hypothetical protein FA048_01655 [Pedobacter polaris]|uniref:Uncharacterized protein n=1 Tax=Pedobacter polaris TaxID=2571273 RepID=A0A4U1CT69_9SPHI|nr:hypothetical protein [Pedobacter polaris]TKC12351.1 hypothetical protein FA048_01655 [Pedobacter polaris]
MKTITIRGEFPNSGNNSLRLLVYSNDFPAKSDDFTKLYKKSFEEKITGMGDKSIYHIGLGGRTTGEIKISITGDFDNPNPIVEIVETGFVRAFTIKTL